ncbi:MAG TPA: glycosyltransferase, partial [Xanthobacteraceae bacterium]|nr:glycosyltransferase [Xanthobacteraceae bacterium]
QERGEGAQAQCQESSAIAPPAAWPRVTAVIPARDEAATIGATVASLLGQSYPGPFAIVLVDDESRDGTADAARAAAQAGGAERLTVLTGQPLPAGWTGKLWAVSQGVAAATAAAPAPDYLLLTDADITYAPEALMRLVARAEQGGYVLTSLMAKLRCVSLAERAFVPAFIYFFQMLYPFAWVNARERKTAAAAGGCMLVRPRALASAGGIAAIRGALIDDCALAAALKKQGPIWLGLTERVMSARAYEHVDDIRRMVARSAYAQLRYSPLRLAGCIAGMALTYLAAPLLTLFASGSAQALGAAAFALMAMSYQPILRFYRRSALWGLALPAIALAYMAFTLDSAYQHGRGRGGLWKGRVQAQVQAQAGTKVGTGVATQTAEPK